MSLYWRRCALALAKFLDQKTKISLNQDLIVLIATIVDMTTAIVDVTTTTGLSSTYKTFLMVRSDSSLSAVVED